VSRVPVVLLPALLLAFGPGPGPRAAFAFPAVPLQFQDDLVVAGFDAPTAAVLVPDGRIFVIEQNTAQVRLVVKGMLSPVDPAGIVPLVRAGGEAGLIGAALDPGFPARPYLYLQATMRSPNSVRILRYTLAGDLDFTDTGAMTLDPASQYTVLGNLPDASPKHNGGQLAFGPDGMLFSGVGDDDNSCRAQDLTRLQGKILRLDVSALPAGGGGPPRYAEITPPDNPFAAHADSAARLVWAFGFRNPFRFSIDPLTGCLHVGDVGNEGWEELDVACAGGMNFGWPHHEANARSTVTCAGIDTTAFVAPVHAYAHVGQGWSIAGGPVYRAPAGADFPFPAEYEGTWFYGDTWRGFVRRLAPDGGGGWAPAPAAPGQPAPEDWANGIAWITSLFVHPDGSLWYTTLYRVDPESGPGELHRIRYIQPSTGVGGGGPAGGLALLAARPSPAAGAAATELAWRQARALPVTLRVFDLRGRLVRTLVGRGDGVRAAGEHRARWDGRGADGRPVPAGVYLAALEAGSGRTTLRLVRL
jgi:glucose/arabinose dehydrogenase